MIQSYYYHPTMNLHCLHLSRHLLVLPVEPQRSLLQSRKLHFFFTPLRTISSFSLLLLRVLYKQLMYEVWGDEGIQ